MTDPRDREEDYADRLWSPIAVRGQNAADMEGVHPSKAVLAIGCLWIDDRRTLASNKLTGTTAFFREKRMDIHALKCAWDLHLRLGRKVSLTIVGGSIGAQAYSLSYEASKLSDAEWLDIRNLDLSPLFLRVARDGIYPRVLEKGIRDNNASILVRPFGKSYFRIKPSFRRAVKVLPAQSMLEMPQKGTRSDIILSSYAMSYVDEDTKPAAMAALAQTTDHIMVLDTNASLGFPAHRNFTRHYESFDYSVWCRPTA